MDYNVEYPSLIKEQSIIVAENIEVETSEVEIAENTSIASVEQDAKNGKKSYAKTSTEYTERKADIELLKHQQYLKRVGNNKVDPPEEAFVEKLKWMVVFRTCSVKEKAIATVPKEVENHLGVFM